MGVVNTFSKTDAETIFDTKGFGNSTGVSGGPPIVSIGYDKTYGYAQDGSLVEGWTIGGGSSVKLPLPFEVHSEIVYTVVTPIVSIPDVHVAWDKFFSQVMNAKSEIYNEIVSYFSKIICEKQKENFKKITGIDAWW